MITVTKKEGLFDIVTINAEYSTFPNGDRILQVISKNRFDSTDQYASVSFSPDSAVQERLILFGVRHYIQVPYISATIVPCLKDENDLASARSYSIVIRFFAGGSHSGVIIPGINFEEIDSNWFHIRESLVKHQGRFFSPFDANLVASTPTYCQG
jgi:hypothetical protein